MSRNIAACNVAGLHQRMAEIHDCMLGILKRRYMKGGQYLARCYY
jgi:hypothetical protein